MIQRTIFQDLLDHLPKRKYEKIRFSPGKIHFWRTKDKAEVDFVIELGPKIIPLEVKYKELKKPEIGRSSST